MAERFAQEAIRGYKRHNVFDLEDDEPTAGLTHGGKPLFDGQGLKDDFDEEDLSSGDESDGSKAERRMLKRMRLEEEGGEGEDGQDDQPDRKRSRAEIMQEVIAKSRKYKYLRQAAKEEDNELRYVRARSGMSRQELLGIISRPQKDRVYRSTH